MIRHIVSFKLKGDAQQRRKVAQQFVDALLQLPARIECLQSMEAGVNDNPNEEWDVALIATVEKMEDVEVYAKHPAHVAAAGIIAPYKEMRACVDFEA